MRTINEKIEHLFKPFYVVELRNGNLYMVVHNEYDGWFLINPDLDIAVIDMIAYNDEMKREFGGDSFLSFDIVRIYGHPKFPVRKTTEISTDSRLIIWKEGWIFSNFLPIMNKNI